MAEETSRPVIAIAGRFCGDDDGNPVAGVQVKRAILRAVVAAGGLPIMLALDEADLIEQGLVLADAVLMPGGGDSNPAMYGQPDPHPKLNLVSAEQDTTDAETLRIARDRGLPILGICRGMQSLNIALGGDLIQHLTPGEVPHPDGTHAIEVCEDGTSVESMMNARRFAGRSFHHQAVDRVAPGMRVTARSDDGVVEAIEHEHRPWVGLQWHPELECATDAVQLGPFRWLVEQAAQRR